MITTKQREEKSQTIATAVHMLRSNVLSLRAAIVLDKPDMITEVVNEMDKTLDDLLRSVRNAN